MKVFGPEWARQWRRTWWVIAQAHSNYRAAYDAGFGAGVRQSARAIRLGRSLPVSLVCPHCQRSVEVDRVMLANLARLAEDKAHARQLWESYTAGAHGHAIEKATA